MKISKNLPGRPENSVKNRFHSHLKKTAEVIEQNEEILRTEKKTSNLTHKSNLERTEKPKNNNFEENEEEKEHFDLRIMFKKNISEEEMNMGMIGSSEKSMKSVKSMKSNKSWNKENSDGFLINSLLPHDVLKLKVKTVSSSDLSLKIQKSCSSESEKKGLTSIKFKEKMF